MQHIAIGSTYKALLGDGKIHTFTAIEDVSENEGTICVRWDDGCEEWNYSEDLCRMMRAAQEKEEEEDHR